MMNVISKHEIEEMVKEGVNKGYSHVMIICDKFDYEYYPKYISYDEDVDKIIEHYDSENFSNLEVIEEIYNYDLDLDMQLNEKRSYHREKHISNKNTTEILVRKGIDKGYSHVIIVNDHYKAIHYPIYIDEEDNYYDIINKLVNIAPLCVVEGIYNYGMNIDFQLKEEHPIHIETIINPIDLDLETRALEFATLKHKGQYRKGKSHEEYITHPIQVAQLVSKYKKSHQLSILKAAAYLHDTLEDTDTTFNELVENFGIGVASLVMEVTTTEEIKDEIGKANYLAIKMRHMSDYALVIKLCDRLSNVSSLFDVDDDFRKRYVNETLFILDDLLENRYLTETQLTIVKDINNILDIIIKNSMPDKENNDCSKRIKEKIKTSSKSN